jgi:hypothetical protein
MIRRSLLIIIICILSSSGCLLTGQPQLNDISVKLEKLFSGLRQDLPAEIKIVKNDSIRSIISSYASSDSVFRHRFSNLRFLGQITSPDSLLKIITWNLILTDGGNSYFCYLIHRDRKKGAGKVFEIKGNYKEGPIRTDTLYSSSDWYGSLYYDLRPFTFEGKVRYILLGIDYGNSFISRKVIDVLSFDQGNIQFGLKCFTDGKTAVPRVVFEYASTAVMSLKFEGDGIIVFDHLSPFSPEMKGNRQFYGPDFSFDSYIFENDFWRLKTDIDIKNK